MGQVADRLTAIQRRIEVACRDAGRDAAEVTLMAVSKTHPPEVMQEAYVSGQRLFGENKVQEAAAKAEQLAGLSQLRWAFVGHLQTKKVKDVVQFADEFHALDSLKVAQALDRRLQSTGRQLDVYIEVNSSGEESKFGLPPQDVQRFATELTHCQALHVRGLMTLAAASQDEQVVAGCFQRMRDLRRRLRDADAVAGSYDELSMGMSGDFELAIAYGATTVRVGQALFGSRRL